MSSFTRGASAAAGDGAGVRQTFRGLQLRTHPDADKAAAQVMLVHADEIVLSDGSRITPSDGLTANIATSGIGGLRAGQSEAASTWYKVLIGSGGSGVGLWLEQAKDHFLDESFTADTHGNALREAATTNVRTAQTFDTDESGPLAFADVKIYRQGTPTGRVWLSLYATVGGVPSGAALASSDKLDVSIIATSAQILRFVFRTPFTVVAGTVYALALDGDYTPSVANNVGYRYAAAGGYGAGAEYRFDGTTWTAAAGGAADLWFKVYITRNDNAPAPPSGYDAGYALIGWVRNDGSSNFVVFLAHDRNVHTQAAATSAVASLTTTDATLTDLSTTVPPVPVDAFFISHGSVSDDAMLFSPYDLGSSNWRFIVTLPTANNYFIGPDVPITHQGIYISRYVGSGTVNARVRGFRW